MRVPDARVAALSRALGSDAPGSCDRAALAASLRAVADALDDDARAADADEPPAPAPSSRLRGAFDITRYPTRHVALRVFYAGWNYRGFASQGAETSDVDTVEGALFAALRKTRLVAPDAVWSDCDYTRCGRTDAGVSALDQVVSLRLRSKRPTCDDEQKTPAPAAERSRADATRSSSREEDASPSPRASSSSRRSPHLPEWDDRSLTGGERRAARRTPEAPAADARDASLEIDYVSVINRARPDDVRVLAWSYVDASFSARFDCSYRHYKYFFADPGGGGLDLDAMRDAARRLEGEHDFRNLCKMDAKNVHNYVRRVDSCRVYAEGEESDEERSDDDDAEEAGMNNGLGLGGEENRQNSARFRDRPRGATSLCHISIKGTAFLWHQVRCVAALLFLVGLGREDPSVVDALLDLRRTPRKPQFEMAPEEPLLLWRVGHQPGTARWTVSAGAKAQLEAHVARHAQRHAARLAHWTHAWTRLARDGLVSPADRLAASAALSVTASSRSAAPHARLAERATEPTYEERREQLRERGGGKARAANAYRATVESFVRDEGLGGDGGEGEDE